MKPITIRFILKSGKEFDVKCSEFTIEKSKITGAPVGYNINGIIENKPLFIDLTEVDAILRVLSDEKE